jgi:FlaA1/EpsC-like NDP-sugar epimerase
LSIANDIHVVIASSSLPAFSLDATRFVRVRFENVFDSSGAVVREEIGYGGPNDASAMVATGG